MDQKLITNLRLTKKQTQALEYLSDNIHTEILYGGSAGSGKSVLGSIWVTLNCIKCSDTRYMIARDDLTTLKRTSIVTLISKVFPMFGLKAEVAYHYSQQEGSIKFSNGSEIIFGYLKYEPSDPEFDRLGSLEITGAWIDEGSEVSEKGYEVLKTRIRHNLDIYGLVPKILITTNPCNNFIKTEFYLPYSRGEDMGRKVFVPSFSNENIFLESSYQAVLDNIKDPLLRRRLRDGDWNYNDAPDNIITNSMIGKSIVNQFPNIDKSVKYVGIDIAREGNDKSMIALIVKDTLLDLREITINQDNLDKSGQIADQIIAYCEDLGVGYDYVALDTVGVGAGVIDNLHSKGFFALEFKGGMRAEDDDNYSNARAEAYWRLREDLISGKFKIFSQVQELEMLTQELTNTKYGNDDKKIKVEKKEKIKKRIGRSPDRADALTIANYVQYMNDKNNYVYATGSDIPQFMM